MGQTIITAYYFLIAVIPLMIAAAIPILVTSPILKIASIALALPLYLISTIIVGGFLGRPWKKAIFPGVFPRKLSHNVYRARRIYGAAWTSIFYNTPIYFLCVSVPFLRTLLFRLFGYQFEMKFTLAPDAWVRDLPCLKFEEGAYVGNKATLGTNMCLSDGTILVDRVKVGKNSMIGHGTMAGPGANLKENVEVSVSVVLGIRSIYKKGSKIGGHAGISHGVIIGENTEIGNFSYIGTKAIIGDNIKVMAGASIPAGAEILTQEECNRYHSSETQMLNSLRVQEMSKIREASQNAETTNPHIGVKTEMASLHHLNVNEGINKKN